MTIGFYVEKVKDVAALAGVGGVLWSVYSVSGLPVPATIKQVEERITAVNDTIKKNQTDTVRQLDIVRVEQVEGQRSVIRLTRVSLRNERTALEKLSKEADLSSKVTIQRRIGEVDDQLKELDENDAELRQRVIRLRQ